MAKRPNDNELEFLKTCTADELAPLVGIVLGTDSEGNIELSGRKTSALQDTLNFKRYYPDHTRYVDEIIEDLQKFGASSPISWIRGYGVSYREMLIDCAEKQKVNFNKDSSTERIEKCLLEKVLRDVWEKLPDEERVKMLKEVGSPSMGGMGAAAFVGLLNAGGFATYRIALIVANGIAKAVLGHGLKLAANAFVTRFLAFLAGPIGWTIATAWILFDIGGPAYRVTIPACTYIAALRLMKKNEDAEA